MERKRLSSLLHFLMLYGVTLVFAKRAPISEDEWGEWASWSPCTRTCGPAISVQERSCLNGTCEGPRKQFRSCPNDPCEEPLALRAELCATYNDSEHSYTPIDGEAQCSLTCKATGEDSVMIVLGPLEALAGTPCRTAHGDEGICVDSLCTPVGCDGVLGSRKEIDKCGRCIGPGEHDEICTQTHRNSTGQEPETGHTEIVVMPAGASSITVTSLLQPQQASLMIRSGSGDYLFTVGPPGSKFMAAGIEFTYNVAVSGENYTERLTASGTLNESITIEVYIPSSEVIPSIIYEYYMLEQNYGAWGTARETGPLVSTVSSIDWAYGHFLPCTDTCATGIQRAFAICKDLDFNRALPDNYCTTEKPLPILRRCGSENCTPRWVTGEWWPCSQTKCGTGFQERLVQCRVLEANGRDRVAPYELCDAATRPADERECVVRDSSGCDTSWEVEEWGECCSGDPLERRIECIDSNSHPQPPFLCSHLPRNSSIRSCNRGPCSNGGCSWVPKRWFTCNNTCGRGMQRRNVRCRNGEGRPAESHCCRDQPLPVLQRECYDDRSNWCQPQWHSGSWEQCTGSCGENNGTRSRRVECLAENRQHVYVHLPDHFCDNQIRSAETEQCTREDLHCSDCEWEAGPWSECYCPLGIRLRTVVCNGNEDCCFERELPDGEPCDCPTHHTTEPSSPTPQTPPSDYPCVDHPLVNCTQLMDCWEDNTDFFEQLCCQTCSNLR